RIKRQHEDELNRAIAIRKVELEELVNERTAELTKQKEELELTLEELRATQSQLIQSEKMASLGELTAGIAHEIQNPLNFVNNFSEVSSELLDEMQAEIDLGNTVEVKQIVADLKQNLKKINHHGKRADSIVKGMLLHSRASTGQKEPVDINALADEYLRLAYHGLRAKDKSFNARFDTDFDENIGKINVIPQDMGRVILNLLTNAFYAVTEKKRALGDAFQPAVTISTRKDGKNVVIRVTDNGNGIPAKIIDKIFQPFFSSKPTGAGTGLGLSMCYEIVTKGHGGKIEVENKEGEGATMIVTIPA
ncbi:MAG TPA: ATP-binding protein, partial [Prolixibacteraceae bacterium]|nr:ATP-binding protein [Prolixibacteraceae bacterium]